LFALALKNDECLKLFEIWAIIHLKTSEFTINNHTTFQAKKNIFCLFEETHGLYSEVYAKSLDGPMSNLTFCLISYAIL